MALDDRSRGRARNKARNKSQELKGQVKEATGRATDNPRLEAEGRADQTKANLKQAAEKVKDALRPPAADAPVDVLIPPSGWDRPGGRHPAFEADLAEIDAILSDAMPVSGPGGHPRPRWCRTAGCRTTTSAAT